MQHKNKYIGNYNFTGDILVDTLSVIFQYKSAYRASELLSYTTYSIEQFEAAKTELYNLGILSKSGGLKPAIKKERYNKSFDSSYYDVPKYFSELITKMTCK